MPMQHHLGLMEHEANFHAWRLAVKSGSPGDTSSLLGEIISIFYAPLTVESLDMEWTAKTSERSS